MNYTKRILDELEANATDQDLAEIINELDEWGQICVNESTSYGDLGGIDAWDLICAVENGQIRTDDDWVLFYDNDTPQTANNIDTLVSLQDVAEYINDNDRFDILERYNIKIKLNPVEVLTEAVSALAKAVGKLDVNNQAVIKIIENVNNNLTDLKDYLQELEEDEE